MTTLEIWGVISIAFVVIGCPVAWTIILIMHDRHKR